MRDCRFPRFPLSLLLLLFLLPTSLGAQAAAPCSSLNAIDVRHQHPDPLGNGVAIGFLSGALLMGLTGPIATGGDAPFLRSAFLGAVPGALIGFILDVAKQRPPDWVRLWPEKDN